MAIVGIYKIALTNSKLGLTKEVMANKVKLLFFLSLNTGLAVIMAIVGTYLTKLISLTPSWD
jgi:hypothetical protein